MYKKLTWRTFVPSIIICALMNLVLFLTIPDARLASPVFWIGWTFTFPVNLIFAVSVWIYIHSKTTAKEGDTMIYLPLLTYVILGATAVYLIAGIIIMYAPIITLTGPIVTECFITGIYGVVLYYAIFAANRVADNTQQTKQKVVYIKLLQSQLESCFVNVKDNDLLSKLKVLSENIRFSDPMSDPSLSVCESELSGVITDIVVKVNSSNLAGIENDITKATALLELRNNRCKILK